jgi:hypothetical protein
VNEAVHDIYDALRWAETLVNVECALITHFIDVKPKVLVSGHEHLDSLFDRIFRATSGKQY